MNGNKSFDDSWRDTKGALTADALEKMVRDAKAELGFFNILISGKSGVGKTTLINKFFGSAVGKVGSGRPVTEHITWYKPPDHPLRLCDTRGLELRDFREILNSLEQEIKRCTSSGKVEDRIHVSWICISETGERVEEGEQELARLCASYGIPFIVVLTKALGPITFADDVARLLPDAKAVVRVLANDWVTPPIESFGLEALLEATYKAIPKDASRAFVAAQQIDFTLKRKHALLLAASCAVAAAGSSAIPAPGIGAGSFLPINISMLLGIAGIVGVELSGSMATAIGVSTVGALAASFTFKMMLGEGLKLIPVIGSIPGSALEGTTALASTYGIGHAFTEFLIWYHRENLRLPGAEEIKEGFARYWKLTKNKSIVPNALT